MDLKKRIEQAKNIVFFGGAGVSTESGIPDFRSDNGLYKKKYRYSAERMVSHSFSDDLSGCQTKQGTFGTGTS